MASLTIVDIIKNPSYFHYKYLIPNEHLKRVEDTPIERLREDGKKAAILDWDDLFAENWKNSFYSQSKRKIARAIQASFDTRILSNGDDWRIETISRNSGIKVIKSDKPKPFEEGYEKAMEDMGVRADETFMMDDKLIGVAGANRLEIYTLAVDPIDITNNPWAIRYFTRPFDRFILSLAASRLQTPSSDNSHK